MNFSLPVWLHNVLLSSIGLPDSDNVGLAIEISFPSHLQADIKVFPVFEAVILVFPLPVWLYSILCSPL